jgi:DNA primase
LLDFTHTKKHKSKISFKEFKVPGEAILLDQTNPEHQHYADYLLKRHINPAEYPFMITPSLPGRYKNRVIIPYTYNNKIVGQTSRFLDTMTPKYLNEQQPGYVFGFDFQRPEWQVCILVEGIFDALSINGCALTHNTINEDQARLLAQLNRRIIVVPDRDLTGMEICDRALELGYSVSIPDWAPYIKDVNDAVIEYGKLPTLLSILEAATSSKIKIEIQRAKIVKRLQRKG